MMHTLSAEILPEKRISLLLSPGLVVRGEAEALRRRGGQAGRVD